MTEVPHMELLITDPDESQCSITTEGDLSPERAEDYLKRAARALRYYNGLRAEVPVVETEP